MLSMCYSVSAGNVIELNIDGMDEVCMGQLTGA